MRLNELIALIALAILESLFTFTSDHEMAIAPLALAGIAAAPGLISSLGGLFGRKKREKNLKGKVQSELDGLQQVGASYEDILNSLNSELGKSYLDTTEGMAFGNRIADRSDDQRRQLSDMVGLSGLSDEALVKGLGNINENEGLQLSNLVSNADRRRAQLRNERFGALRGKSNTFNNLMSTKLGLFDAARNQNRQAMQNTYDGLNQAATGFLTSQLYGQGSSKPQGLFRSSAKSPGQVTGGITQAALPNFQFG